MTWREIVLDLVHIVPLVCLLFDMIFNKIKIPFRQINVSIFFIIVWITCSYVGQEVMSSTLPSFPPYASNLNWSCKINYSYYFELKIDNSTQRFFDVLGTYPNTCGRFYESETYTNLTQDYSKDKIECMPSYLFYYCDLPQEDALPDNP